MGLASWLFGSGVKESGEGINAALDGVGGLAKDIRTAITGKDPAAEAKLAELQTKLQEAQITLNMQEAKHASIFVAGWRPFIGWVGGFGLAYTFLIHPFLLWLSAILDAQGVINGFKPPALNTEGLITIVLAMLGLVTARTIEKKIGVQNNH